MIYTILKLRVSLLSDTEPEIWEGAVFELFVFTSFLASKIGQFLEKKLLRDPSKPPFIFKIVQDLDFTASYWLGKIFKFPTKVKNWLRYVIFSQHRKKDK